MYLTAKDNSLESATVITQADSKQPMFVQEKSAADKMADTLYKQKRLIYEG